MVVTITISSYKLQILLSKQYFPLKGISFLREMIESRFKTGNIKMSLNLLPPKMQESKPSKTSRNMSKRPGANLKSIPLAPPAKKKPTKKNKPKN